MGVGNNHGGGNAVRLDADDHDDHNDDADDGIDRWQPSLTGCRYVNPSQDMTKPVFLPQRTKRTFSGESFFHSPKSLSRFEKQREEN